MCSRQSVKETEHVEVQARVKIIANFMNNLIYLMEISNADVLEFSIVLIISKDSFIIVDTKGMAIPKFYVTRYPLIVYMSHSITIFLDSYLNERHGHYVATSIRH